jgi:CBS-domain-containing membrane protein
MKRNVTSIQLKTSIHDAATLIVKKHIGLLPVVDDEGSPIGVIGMRDLLKLEMPAFVDFVADVDFVHDFGAVEDMRPSAAMLKKSVKTIMRPVLTVDENCGLLRAYSLMLQQHLHDIPVVSEDGKLSGIASRVDIGVAILSTWFKEDS